jgi:S-adenosylmethionine:tRNA ribosyltransferase-isomerase
MRDLTPADFDFELPEDRIALAPIRPRDRARLLVVEQGRDVRDLVVADLPRLLRAGDALVVNDTRVIPAALAGTRVRGAYRAHVELNLIKRVDASRWRAFARPAKRLEISDRIQFGGDAHVGRPDGLCATVIAKGQAGEVEIAFDSAGPDLDAGLAAVGVTPLPPYIALKRDAASTDPADYQTVYAANDGAVAAPTAGLHFTPELLARLAGAGISRHHVTLHVGAGTFLPVKAARLADHRMHAEWGEITAATAAALNQVRSGGGRIVAVGTTSLRLLESAATPDGQIHPFSGETDIFITPGYRFRAVDVLMTNFHLPRSTLLMLVSAFAGIDTMRAAYADAIAGGYRFYSFGDASLLFRRSHETGPI